MNIEIQSCGLLMLVILLIILLREKSLDLSRRRKFIATMVSCMVCVVMDIISVIAIVNASRGNFPDSATFVICKLYLIFLINVGYRSFVYAAGEFFDESTHRIVRIIYRTIVILGMFFIAILPIDYYCSGRVVYSHGPSTMVTYALAFILLVSTVLIAITGGKSTSRRRKRVIILWQMSWIIAAFIQFVRPELLLVSFAASFGIVIVYAELENPNEGIERVTGQFTANRLYTYTIELYKRNQPFSSMHLSVDYGAGDFDLELETQAMRRIAYFLDRDKKGSYIFRESDRDFVVIYKSEDKLYEDYERAREHLEETVGMPVKIAYTLIPDSRIFDNADEFMQFQHFNVRNADTSTSVIAGKSHAEEMREYLKTRDQIIWALANNGVEVYYQPIYNVKKNAFTTAEALVRIRDNNGNLINPGSFITIAEENGLIIPLGTEVFRQVCALLASKEPQKYGLEYMEINLSMAQFNENEPAGSLIRIMDEYGIDPHMINLEITETAASSTKQVVLKNMNTLIEHGVHFSLDDFGTGRSNFDYFFEMPVDVVKFDYKFTHWYFESERSENIVKSIVGIMSRMDLPIVMEGIETREQLDAMIELGASFIQGFYFSKPIPEKEFMAFLREKSGEN